MFPNPTAPQDWVVILPVALLLASAGLLVVARRLPGVQAGFSALVVIVVAVYETGLLRRIWAEGPVTMTMGNWLPPFGISFTADLLGTAAALLASLLLLVGMAYARLERAGADNRDGFYPLLLVLLAGVSGALLTGDLFNLYVWFEVMLIASFGLLVLGDRDVVLDGAIKYGVLNFLATTFFLFALGLTYGTLGTLNMADIALKAGGADPAAMAGIAALLLLAFGMKAAAFPVNAWLPASYHTTNVVTSALFAGLLTKVGLYALLRALIMLMPASAAVIEPAVVAVALATMILGPLGAIAETNLRRAMGFMVIGGIGAALTGLVLPNAAGVGGSVFYLLHSMATMMALYLVAGLIERATGESDTRRMGGLYAADSLVSMLFFVLVLAVAGIPPLLGFWPKLLLLQGLFALSGLAGGAAVDVVPLVTALALLANAFLTLIAGTRLWAHIFWRAGTEGVQSELPNPNLRVLTWAREGFGLGAALVLTAAILAAGLWPAPVYDLAGEAARGLLAPVGYIVSVGQGVTP